MKKRVTALTIVLLAGLMLLVICGAGFGAMAIAPHDIAAIILSKIGGTQPQAVPSNVIAVVWELRLPRVLCAILVGAGLAAAGVIFQAILQNPLADPYTMGVSSGAAFGASLALLLSVSYGIFLPITPMGLLGALLALAVVLTLSASGRGFSTTTMVVAGMLVSVVLSAGVSFLKLLAGENVGVIVFWLMGGFDAKSWAEVALLTPVVSLCVAAAFLFAKDLNVMALGEKQAQSLGLNVRRARFLYLLLGAALTAVCVSTCGMIGFVGLIVPHLLRFRLTADNRVLLPLSALLGGLLLGTADFCTRVFTQGEVPVGVLTTLLGGPFFLYIFLRRKGGETLE